MSRRAREAARVVDYSKFVHCTTGDGKTIDGSFSAGRDVARGPRPHPRTRPPPRHPHPRPRLTYASSGTAGQTNTAYNPANHRALRAIQNTAA